MVYISPEKLAENKRLVKESHEKNQRDYEEKLRKVKELRTNPDGLSLHERRERFEEAQNMTTKNELTGANHRYFTKKNKEGEEVPYRAFAHPEVFAPGGYLSSKYAEVPEDESKRRGGQSNAFHWGGLRGGQATVAIFAMENGDAVVMRRLEAGDPRLPDRVIHAQEQARASGIDPDLSADYQYFEVRSSQSLREGKRRPGQGKVIHSSAFDEVVVIPGLPLKLGEDKLSGITPAETKEAVAAIFTLDDSEKGKMPDHSKVKDDPSNNLNELREEVGEALGTGKKVVRSLGGVGLRSGVT